MVEWHFLAVPWGCQRFAIVVFPDHTHYFWHTDDVDDGQSFLKAEKEMRVEMQRFIVTF